MQENRIRITWYGTASVRITAGDSRLLIDPFFPYPESRVKVETDAFAGCSRILVSHGHFDHISSIPLLIRQDTLIFCTKVPYRSLCRMGVAESHLHCIRKRFAVNEYCKTGRECSKSCVRLQHAGKGMKPSAIS